MLSEVFRSCWGSATITVIVAPSWDARVVSPMDKGSEYWGVGRLGFEEGIGTRRYVADPGSWLLVLARKMAWWQTGGS